jgi:hypothetical protein
VRAKNKLQNLKPREVIQVFNKPGVAGDVLLLLGKPFSADPGRAKGLLYKQLYHSLIREEFKN